MSDMHSLLEDAGSFSLVYSKRTGIFVLLRHGKPTSGITSILIAFLLAIRKLMEEVFLAGPVSKIRTTLLKEHCTGKILFL